MPTYLNFKNPSGLVDFLTKHGVDAVEAKKAVGIMGDLMFMTGEPVKEHSSRGLMIGVNCETASILYKYGQRRVRLYRSVI